MRKQLGGSPVQPLVPGQWEIASAGVGQIVASLGNGLRSMNGATGGLGSQVAPHSLLTKRFGQRTEAQGASKGCGIDIVH